MHFTTWLISIVPRALLFLRHNDPNNDILYCVQNIKLITYHSSICKFQKSPLSHGNYHGYNKFGLRKWLMLNHSWNELQLAAVLHVPIAKWLSLIVEPNQMSVKQKLGNQRDQAVSDRHHQHMCIILVAVAVLIHLYFVCCPLLCRCFKAVLAFQNFTLTGHLLKEKKSWYIQ